MHRPMGLSTLRGTAKPEFLGETDFVFQVEPYVKGRCSPLGGAPLHFPGDSQSLTGVGGDEELWGVTEAMPGTRAGERGVSCAVSHCGSLPPLGLQMLPDILLQTTTLTG